MMLYTEFFNNSNFIIKFIVINIHEASDVFSYVISLYHLSQLILFHQQKLHFAMYCQILSQQF